MPGTSKNPKNYVRLPYPLILWTLHVPLVRAKEEFVQGPARFALVAGGPTVAIGLGSSAFVFIVRLSSLPCRLQTWWRLALCPERRSVLREHKTFTAISFQFLLQIALCTVIPVPFLHSER